MKKIFSFTKKKKYPSGTPDSGSVLSVGYELKDKDLGKVHKAASVGDLAKLKQLAKKNDINQLDKENRTALHIACAGGHVEVVQYLVESKAKLNLCDNQNRSALMKAVQGQHERCVSILLENRAEPGLVDINGNTGLHLAANIPSISTAVLLLEHGANINAPNKDGFTPLIVAVREDHIEMAEFLLKEEADVNCLDQDQRSPLMIAASNGQIGMLRLLLQFDADIALKDTKGWSADDYAAMNGHHPCSHLIIEHGTQRMDGPSLSQSHSKKKKKTLLGSPSQDVEAGFSLGGPATDKDDFEDNSQSESLSRVSKSAADEWPSSEDDDESVSIEKKPHKVNLRKMIASKKGEASALPDRSMSGTESEPESENRIQRIPSLPKALPSSRALQHPIDPSPIPFLPSEPQMMSTPLPSYRKEKNKASEQPSSSKAKSDSQNGSPESDEEEEEGEEEEDDEEEEEEEEEENDEEEDDDEDEEEEDDEEEDDDDEEEEEEEEDGNGESEEEAEEENEREAEDDKCAASVEANAQFEDKRKLSVTDALKIIDSSDAQNLQTSPCSGPENTTKTETQNTDLISPARTSSFALPVTLGVAEDCVVSAIRVESKFSDDESLVNECDEVFKKDKRRSSWGSSLEESDGDNCDSPKEEDKVDKTVDQKKDVQPSDSKSSLPQPKDDSIWDSASENHEVRSPVSGTNRPANAPGEEKQCSDGSLKGEDKDSVTIQSNDPSPAVSPIPEDENTTRIQKLNDDEVKSISQKEEKFDLDNQKDNDSSWDDEEESDESEKQMAKDDEVAEFGDVLNKLTNLLSPKSRPRSSVDNILEEEVGVALLKPNKSDLQIKSPEDNRPEEETLSNVKEDDETSEDSDSMDQKLQYDFVSATVKVPGAGADSDNLEGRPSRQVDNPSESEATLTAYVPLKNKSAIPPQTQMLSYDLTKEPIREKAFSRPAARAEAGQPHESDDDEALPQTDIDDVDVDSPDEAESLGTRCPEVRNIEEPVNQKEDSTEDEDDHDKEEEEDVSDEDDHPEESGDSFNATPANPETAVSKDKKRDFLSELGLEKGEEEQDSWDSESHSENASMSHNEKRNVQSLNQEEASPAEKETKEIVSSNNGGDGGEQADNSTLKETEKAKWEPLLSKLEGGHNQKTDVMEELGLGDVDDLEDASDWDTASTTSRRTLPGRRLASPGIEELPECSSPSVKEKEEEEDVSPAAPLTPQRSFSSDSKQPITPQRAPHPQPRVRRMVFQKPESEEESDWEADNLTSGKTTKTGDQLENTTQLGAAVKADSGVPSPRDDTSHVESDMDQKKEKVDALDTCKLNVKTPRPSGHKDSDNLEKDNEFGGQCGPGGGGEESGGVPWEKRYEKLWVEVEKREVKSTFKNVAGELKERFGELFKSSRAVEDEEATNESTSAEEEEDEEESSEEEEGEVIIRPTARARSTILLTIPEQRESGLEDSESADNSLCEERTRVCKSIACPEPEPDPPAADVPGESIRCVDDDTVPTSDADQSSFKADEIKPELELLSEDTPDNRITENNHVSSEEDPEALAKSKPHSLSRRSGSIPDISDEKSEGDSKKFKFEVGKETEKTAMELQRPAASWDAGGTRSEGAGTKKPETRLRGRNEPSSQAGATQQEQQPTVTKSTSRAPVQLQLPVQQTCSNSKQEGPAVVETLQLELVRKAQGSRAPQTSTHVNGDPLSVFDDSTLSDSSDDEGRLLMGEQQKSENPGEKEMAEDFDELTQSSDTATDDIDSPTSGYRHASLLIQKLDSATLDSRSMVKLQNIFHEYERSIQKARSRHGYLSDKVSQLDIERAELKSSLEDVKDAKSALERNQLELQTEVTNLKFQLKQEQENGRNATMMYNTTRDKLRRTEEQQQFEVQERQKVELTLRNLELEMRTLVNNMKQLEEDHSETQRLLAQERSARTLQENLFNSHLRKQQEIEEENKRNLSKSNEALSQLTEASDRERELQQQISTLQEQLSVLRTELERSQANSSLKERHLLEESEALKEQLEDARRDLKLNSEALTQTVFTCNNQMTTLKSELAMTATRLENERQARETLATEVESTRARLAGAVQEAGRCLAAQTETEKTLLREKEEHQRLKDKLTGEAASQREAVSSLSQKLAKAEANANTMENELHRATLQLTEKGLLLDVLQREKDQATARAKELETALQAEKGLASRAGARQETTQERLVQAQSESMLLRQQLEEAQNKGVAKERAVTDAQERFSEILSKLRSDCEERVQLVEERNKELASKAADLRDQIYKLEEAKNERETSVRQLQQELADSLKKLSMSEASLEVNTRYRNDLEEEKTRLLKDMDRLRGKLDESEDQYVQAERRINGLKSSLDEKEKELTTATQKLQEALFTSAASDTTVKQLEEAVQRLEIENARLEAAAKQQSNKIEALQKGAQEAAMVKGHLENLVTNLQSSKMTLEDQLNREVQKQSMLSHTAQDSQALWEEELKSRSKLGLRLAELDKEKQELNTQMEIEKKKAKKISEQKKAVDTRLDQEMKRNTDLQKEMYRLRTLLKTAKKKLRDQDAGGAEFGSPMSSLRMDMGRHGQTEGAVGRMKEKVDDLQVQLEKEASRRSQLEKTNAELKDQLASLKSLSRSNDQLERSKRQLEEEVLELRRRAEAAQIDQSQVEQYRREAEERARQEIQQKLEQVNLFLQSQAASQEALDQIKAANEANLRSQLEQKIRGLEGDLGRARSSQQDSLNQRDSTHTELERYRQLYAEELHLRKSLTAKLDRANSRLAEANSKLLSERSRSLITSSFANGSLGAPPLDVGSLASPANYGASLSPLNRSLGLGLSLLNPVSEGQNSRVEDFLAKMQNELDRTISKELNNATVELDAASARMSPVGSASRAELDPVSRAQQQYLEVLKKNHMI